MSDWKIFRGKDPVPNRLHRLREAPPWRDFDDLAERDQKRGQTYRLGEPEVEAVNAALYLRRPLLVTGPPGSGKSSLAYAIKEDLDLGPVLHWPISSRSTLADGFYSYDAIARLRDAELAARDPEAAHAVADIGNYLRLNGMGTALHLSVDRPRVLLIDEIDKSDLDLPNDLLHVLEEGQFIIPELARLTDRQPTVKVPTGDPDAGRVPVHAGVIRCQMFPIIVLTSNGEREFPPAFLRRCLRLDLKAPDDKQLARIVRAHLPNLEAKDTKQRDDLIAEFVKRVKKGDVLASDQMLNALYLVTRGGIDKARSREALIELLLRGLNR